MKKMTTEQLENLQDAATKCINSHMASDNPIRSMEECLINCREQLPKLTNKPAIIFLKDLINRLEDELFTVRELPKF